jgi:hypothetical protein
MDWFWWKQRLGKDQARNWRRHAEDAPPRPRVLLESADGAEAHAVWKLLDRHGYDTMWCPGPTSHPARACSLVVSGHCPLVDRADVIVHALDQNDGKCGEVARRLDSAADVAAHRRPVVVVTPPTAVAEVAATLPHCDVVPGPLRTPVLLRVVSQARPPQMQEAERASR